MIDDRDRDVFCTFPAGDNEGGVGGELVGDVGEISSLARVRRQ